MDGEKDDEQLSSYVCAVKNSEAQDLERRRAAIANSLSEEGGGGEEEEDYLQDCQMQGTMEEPPMEEPELCPAEFSDGDGRSEVEMITKRERKLRRRRIEEDRRQRQSREKQARKKAEAYIVNQLPKATTEPEEEKPSYVPDWVGELHSSHRLRWLAGSTYCRNCAGTCTGVKRSMLHRPCRREAFALPMLAALEGGKFPSAWKPNKPCWPDGGARDKVRKSWAICRCERQDRVHVREAHCKLGCAEQERASGDA